MWILELKDSQFKTRTVSYNRQEDAYKTASEEIIRYLKTDPVKNGAIPYGVLPYLEKCHNDGWYGFVVSEYSEQTTNVNCMRVNVFEMFVSKEKTFQDISSVTCKKCNDSGMLNLGFYKRECECRLK